MDNQGNQQTEDIFEDVGSESVIKREINKEKYSSENLENSENPSNKPPWEVKPPKNFRGDKGIFVLIARLLIIIAIIIAIGFGVLYFWNKFENKDVVVENEILTEPADNTTSTPSIIIEEPKEKPLDTDSDGLTDTEERQLGTRIDSPDTDQDGLSDRLEVKIYFTNPLSADTDKDGISDKEEIEKGLNPDDPTPGAKLFDLKEEIKALK